MPKQKGEFRVGTSGYQYDHWKGTFYPEDIPRKQWFEFYADHFDTVEINNTFYNLPEESTFKTWRDRAPDGFLYVLKFSRYGSHLKRLKEPRGTVGLFLERTEPLHECMGPILVQLPPNWNPVPERLDRFLQVAPSRFRWVLEFRDPAWLNDAIFDILRKHKAALCIHDMIENHPEVFTADWTYLRFHGVHYGGNYSYQKLSAVARKIRNYLSNGRDVYAYFNNDAEGWAVPNAQDLRRYVEQ